DRRPELQEPPPDRLVGCVNTALGQQFLDIPKGQGEPGIEPDRVADDFWREAVALKRYWSHPMMLIGDEPQSYPSYRDIAALVGARRVVAHTTSNGSINRQATVEKKFLAECDFLRSLRIVGGHRRTSGLDWNRCGHG